MTTEKETQTTGQTTAVAGVQQEQGYVKWENRTNEERLESINTYYKMILAKSIGEKKEFWDKDMSSEEIDNTIPYNPYTSIPYNGIDSLVLRAVQALNGYEDSNFLTMRQANLMHGKLKFTMGKDENGQEKKDYVKGVKLAYLNYYEYKPKLDREGKPLMREREKDGEIIKEPVMEKVFLEKPKLETKTLYHVSQFDDLDKDLLKGRDLEYLRVPRERHKNEPFDLRARVDVLGLGQFATQDLNNFLTSQMKGIDYKKIQHQTLNQIRTQLQEKEQGRSL